MISSTALHNETDAQLVALSRGGDTSAFETIVERYRAALVARAASRLGSLADAEDVAQDAFVQAYFHLHELRDPGALLPWLRRVTERIALMRLRSRRETPVAPGDMELISGGARYDAGPECVVDSVLTALPESMRETISLTLLAGYTCAETARILGVEEGTVKSRLNRARAKLKEELGMADRDIGGARPAGDFTRKTIERLKREARRLAEQGKVEEASAVAGAVLAEQVKPLFGDPEELGLARTFLAAYDSPAFRPDEEAVATLGLLRREQRRTECEANAAQYGFTLDELDWELEDVNVMSCTLGRPCGHGQDTWGVPISRMSLDIVDARELCRRLRVSPLTLQEWVVDGCPILRCWPFARFDVERVTKWLAEKAITGWPQESGYDLERPIRVILGAVYDGSITPEQAEHVMRDLGYGVWEAPMPLSGGW